MLYLNPQAVVQVNRERSEAFALEWLVRQDCPLSPPLYVLALEPLLCGLRDGTANPPCPKSFLLAVSERKSLRTWRAAFPGQDPSAGVMDPSASLGLWFGPSLQLKRNWLEVGAKVEAQVGTRFRRRLSLRGKAEVCAVYIFSLILYRLSVLPLPRGHRLVLIQSHSKLLWSDRKPVVCRLFCCQRPRNGGLGMPDLESHWLVERLAYLGRSLSRGTVWGQKVKDVFPRLESDPKVEGRRKPKGTAPFTCECRKALHKLPRFSDLSRSRKELYRDIGVGSTSDPFGVTSGSGRPASIPNSSCCSTLVTSWTMLTPPYRGEKGVVFLAILTVVRMVIGRRERRDCITEQTFLIGIWFCSLDISLESKSDAIKNA